MCLKFHSTLKPVVIDKPLDENAVGGGRRVDRGVIDELLEMLHSSVGLAAIKVSLEDEIMSDDVGDDAGLRDEAVEREKIRVARLAEERGEDGVDGENGGAAIGVDRVARV